jgi:hypothetical protein
MEAAISPLPDDVEALKALVTTMARKADEAEAELANAMAHQSAIEALIAHLKLQIAKLKREQYGPSAEHSRRLIDQMELQFEELEADAAEDDLIAEEAAAKTTTATAFERKRPARKPFPDHLPRERVVVPAPCSCPACGGDRLSKLGEDVTETLEVILRSWKVIQTGGRSSRAGTARRSRRPRLLSMWSRADGPDPASSPCSCSRSMSSTNRSASRPLPTRSARLLTR